MPRKGIRGRLVRVPAPPLARPPEYEHCCRCHHRLMKDRPVRTIGTAPGEYCRDCYGQVMARLLGFGGRERHAEATYLRKYGIGLREYGDLYAGQHGVCAICHDRGRSTEAGSKMLAVDHDHATGKVRGLLCDRCNRGIGYFADSTTYLESAIDYLRRL